MLFIFVVVCRGFLLELAGSAIAMIQLDFAAAGHLSAHVPAVAGHSLLAIRT